MTDDKMTWSPQAHRNAKIGASSRTNALKMRRWKRGPILHEDKIIVPSDFYHPAIGAFFKSQGFQFNSEFRQWWRDIRWPHRGRRYTAEAWLKAARRKFDEIWNRKELES